MSAALPPRSTTAFWGWAFLAGLGMLVAVLWMLIAPQADAPQRPLEALKVKTAQAATVAGDPGASFALPHLGHPPAVSAEAIRALKTSAGTVSFPMIEALAVYSELDRIEPPDTRWYRFSHTVAASEPFAPTPSEPMAIHITRIMGGPHAIYVNGELIDQPLRDWRIQWSKPIYVQLPRHLAQPGAALDIHLAVKHRAAQGHTVGSVYVGLSRELDALVAWRTLFQRTLPILGCALVLMLSVMSLYTWRHLPAETEHGWLAALGLAVFVSQLQFLSDFSLDEQRSVWFGTLVDSAVQWLFLFFTVFGLRFLRAPRPRIEWALLAYTGASTVVSLPVWDWGVTALRAQHYLTLSVYVGVVFLFAWQAWQQRSATAWILFGAIATLFVSGFHDITVMTAQSNPDGYWTFPISAFVVFIVGDLLLRQRYAAARTAVQEANETLALRLQAKEDELAAAHSREVGLQRREAVAAERERLIADIHDGIGAQLIHTAAALRGAGASTEQAAQWVDACLNDLRAVIESLDPGNHTLANLLATVRHRSIEPLQSAGLNVEWEVDDALENWLLEPAQALDWMRILNEWMANSIRHAQASSISLRARLAERRNLEVVLSDDGKGMSAEALAVCIAALGGALTMPTPGASPQFARVGRGYGGLAVRLHRIGARATLASGPALTRLTLVATARD